MSTLSTHDTKRCEDVRARIAPIAQYTDEWLEMLAKARDIVADDRPGDLNGQSENLLWQTLIGTWTPEGPISEERLEAYLLKASREQKLWTTWTEQNERVQRTHLRRRPHAHPRAKGHSIDQRGRARHLQRRGDHPDLPRGSG